MTAEGPDVADLSAAHERWVELYGADRRLAWSHPGYLTPVWALEDSLPPLDMPNLYDYVATGWQFTNAPAPWGRLGVARLREALSVRDGRTLPVGWSEQVEAQIIRRFGPYIADEKLIVRVGPRFWWRRDPMLGTIVCDAVALAEADHHSDPVRWNTPPRVMPGTA